MNFDLKKKKKRCGELLTIKSNAKERKNWRKCQTTKSDSLSLSLSLGRVVAGLERLKVADNYREGNIAVDQVRTTSSALRRGPDNY